MSKKMPTHTITNELKGSAWFRPAAATAEQEDAPAAAPERSPARSVQPHAANERTDSTERTERSPVQSGPAHAANGRTASTARTERPAVHPPKETRTKRRAYDLYETQLSGLRRIRATRELALDANVSYSELVREAIDLLLRQEGLA